MGNADVLTNKGAIKILIAPLFYYGTPGWIRTSDLQLRRLTPYPLGYGRLLSFHKRHLLALSRVFILLKSLP